MTTDSKQAALGTTRPKGSAKENGRFAKALKQKTKPSGNGNRDSHENGRKAEGRKTAVSETDRTNRPRNGRFMNKTSLKTTAKQKVKKRPFYQGA